MILGMQRRRVAFLRKVVVLLSVLVFAAAVWLLRGYGYVQTTATGLLALLSVWSAGVAILLGSIVLFPHVSDRSPTLVFSLSVWVITGVVIVAGLVPGELRLLLLCTVVLGIFYASTRLSAGHVIQLGLFSWFTYVIDLVLFERYLTSDFEKASLVAFTILIAGAVWLGLEVTALRAELLRNNEALRNAARRDALTGLYNRREFVDHANRLKAMADRGGESFSLSFLDLDHFKRVNDRFGHAFGDEVLVRFAQVCARAVRDEDLVARVGGEEFIALLYNATEAEANRVIERIRLETRELVRDVPDPSMTLTVSGGVARYRPGETIDELARRADAALYRAKSAGRDRLEYASHVAAARSAT